MMRRGMKPPTKRPSRQPTASEYESAIQKTEAAFAANKTRMWVLHILREAIVREIDGDKDL